MKTLQTIYIWFAGISIAFAIILIIALVMDIAYFMTGDIASVPHTVFTLMKRNPGDFSWGSVGVLLSFGSVLLMVATLSSQKSQFKEQFDSEKSARFENTFFNLLSMFYNVRNETNKTISLNITSRGITWHGNRNLEGLAKHLLAEFNSDSVLQQEVTRISKDIPSSNHALQQLKTIYGNKFTACLNNIGNPTSYYYRYISNLIEYVIDSWKGDKDQIIKYLDFIQAQMSDEELCLLFYNCISSLSKDGDYRFHLHDCINRYNFLQNLPAAWLDNRNNHFFYDSTFFRFLSRDETSLKKT